MRAPRRDCPGLRRSPLGRIICPVATNAAAAAAYTTSDHKLLLMYYILSAYIITTTTTTTCTVLQQLLLLRRRIGIRLNKTQRSSSSSSSKPGQACVSIGHIECVEEKCAFAGAAIETKGLVFKSRWINVCPLSNLSAAELEKSGKPGAAAVVFLSSGWEQRIVM